MALIGSVIAGPIGAAVPIIAMGVITGAKVNKALKQREKAEQYSDTLKQLLQNDYPKEDIEKTPPEVIVGISSLFVKKYPKKEDFDKITPEQFRNDLAEFLQQSAKDSNLSAVNSK